MVERGTFQLFNFSTSFLAVCFQFIQVQLFIASLRFAAWNKYSFPLDSLIDSVWCFVFKGSWWSGIAIHPYLKRHVCVVSLIIVFFSDHWSCWIAMCSCFLLVILHDSGLQKLQPSPRTSNRVRTNALKAAKTECVFDLWCGWWERNSWIAEVIRAAMWAVWESVPRASLSTFHVYLVGINTCPLSSVLRKEHEGRQGCLVDRDLLGLSFDWTFTSRTSVTRASFHFLRTSMDPQPRERFPLMRTKWRENSYSMYEPWFIWTWSEVITRPHCSTPWNKSNQFFLEISHTPMCTCSD